jgi:hypothetical protein
MAFPRLAVGPDHVLERTDHHHDGVFGDGNHRSFRRQRDPDAAGTERRHVERILVADPLMEDELQPTGGVDQRFGEAHRCLDDDFAVADLGLALGLVVAIERHDLDIIRRSRPDRAIDLRRGPRDIENLFPRHEFSFRSHDRDWRIYASPGFSRTNFCSERSGFGTGVSGKVSGQAESETSAT